MAFQSKTLTRMVGAAALGLMTMAGTAQAWEPAKPIDFVIMAGAGGGADQIARFLQSVSEKKDMTQPAAGAQQQGRRLGRRGADRAQHHQRPRSTRSW